MARCKAQANGWAEEAWPPTQSQQVLTQARQSPRPSLALQQVPGTEARSRAGTLPRPAPSYLLSRGGMAGHLSWEQPRVLQVLYLLSPGWAGRGQS